MWCHLSLRLIVRLNLTTSAKFPVWLISQSCLFLLPPSLFHLFSLYPLYSSASLPNWLLFVQQNSGWEPSCVCLCPLLASSECFNDLIAGLCVSVGRCSTHGQVKTWLVIVILIKDRGSTTGNIMKAHYEVSIQLSACICTPILKG